MEEKQMLQLIYDELRGVKEDVSGIKEEISEMKEDISGMKEEIAVIKKDVSKLENKVTDIQLTLENETNRNIRIVAEGHIDLSRKLNDALKVADDDEMLRIRVNIMENDIRRLKQERDLPI